jgi:hypothetical protein
MFALTGFLIFEVGDWTTTSCVNGCVEGDANPDCGGIVDADITHATFN